MIGDGMGRNHVEMARWEKAGHDPAKYLTTILAMDGLDYVGNVSTASANAAITDSAAAATALMTGTRTNNGMIGISPNGTSLTTIAELADAGGRSTGALTNTRITDATPAGAYAHVTSRTNELPIASQFIDSDLEVALGGGYQNFIPTGTTDPFSGAGLRTDGPYLVTEAQAQGYTAATTANTLSAVPATWHKGPRALRLGLDGYVSAPVAQQPSLAAMTDKALSILSRSRTASS